MTGMIFVRAASAKALPDAMRQIEERFASSDAPVRAMTEQAFGQMFADMIGNVQAFIRNTAMAVVFSLVCVAGNAMAMSMRERTREVAVLKAIGFQRSTILGMVLGEALAIAIMGGILGVATVKLMFAIVDPGVLGIPGLALFYVPWRTAVFGLSLAAVVGLASGAIPAWRAAQLSVVDGLRKVV
jgi:putative ABC transport system permease protein